MDKMWRMWMILVVGWWSSSSSVATAAAIAETLEYKWQQPCPNHPDLQGYTSLEALQSELRQHDAWVVAVSSSSTTTSTTTTTEEEEEALVLEYPLCPRTILNTTSQPLLIPPTLLEKYPLFISCLSVSSEQQQPSYSCIVRGGSTQVLVVESQQPQQAQPAQEEPQQLVFEAEPGPPGPSLTLQGMIFENSQDISIAILHETVTLQCVDCHWKGCRGKSAIVLAEASQVTSTWEEENDNVRVSYALNDHNIFGERHEHRQRQRQLNPNEKDNTLFLGPTFHCIDCSFQDSGEVAAEGLETLLDADTLTTTTTTTHPFILMDSYRPNAHIYLESCEISKITGAFLINALHSAQVTLDQVLMQDSSVSLGLVRVQYDSYLTATKWTTRQNKGRATLICAHSSQAYLDGISFSDGASITTPILALSQGHVQLESYCMTTASVHHAAIVVDSSSHSVVAITYDDDSSSSSWNRILTTSTTTTSQSSSSSWLLFDKAPPTFDCQGPIWHLTESANSISVPCWDIGHCSGTCSGLDLWRILDNDDKVTTTTTTCPSVEVLLEATAQAQKNNSVSVSGKRIMAAAIFAGSLALWGLVV